MLTCTVKCATASKFSEEKYKNGQKCYLLIILLCLMGFYFMAVLLRERNNNRWYSTTFNHRNYFRKTAQEQQLQQVWSKWNKVFAASLGNNGVCVCFLYQMSLDNLKVYLNLCYNLNTCVSCLVWLHLRIFHRILKSQQPVRHKVIITNRNEGNCKN